MVASIRPSISPKKSHDQSRSLCVCNQSADVVDWLLISFTCSFYSGLEQQEKTWIMITMIMFSATGILSILGPHLIDLIEEEHWQRLSMHLLLLKILKEMVYNGTILRVLQQGIEWQTKTQAVQ